MLTQVGDRGKASDSRSSPSGAEGDQLTCADLLLRSFIHYPGEASPLLYGRYGQYYHVHGLVFVVVEEEELGEWWRGRVEA